MAALGLFLHEVRAFRGWTGAFVAGMAFFALDWGVSTWRWGVPWALLGHSQVDALGVAQLAVVGGVPLVSGLLAAIGCALWRAAELRSRESLGCTASCLAGWLALAAFGVPLAEWARPASPSDPAPEVELLMVQPNVPRGERWAEDLQESILRRTASFTERVLEGAKQTPTAILWPENLVTTPLESSPELASALQGWVDRLGVPVITGAARAARSAEPRRYRSSVLWLAPEEGLIAELDKTRAIPILESATEFPGARFVAGAFGGAADWKKVEEESVTGPLRGPFTVTPALCYEALFPGIVEARRAPESVAILNLADDSWTAGEMATRQLAAFATFRAIEQRLPLIRVAHGGLSVVVDELGRTVEALPLDSYASTTVLVSPKPPVTLQERLAILSLPLLAGLGVWWASRAWFARARGGTRDAS